MSHDPLIAAARRRARLLQRADARPYQTHLDEVARTAGSRDWSTFVADPKPIPEPPGADEPHEPADHKLAWLTLACLGGGALAFCSAAMDVANGEGMLWTIVAGCVVMTLSHLPLSIGNLLRRLPDSSAERDAEDDRRWTARNSACRGMALSTIAVCIACLGIMAMRNHVDQETMGDVIADRSERARMTFAAATRPVPVTGMNRNGDMTRLRAVFVDARLGWISFRNGLELGDRAGGEAMVESYVRHPVIRMVLDVDCRSGRWRPVGIETADDYDGPAARSHRHRPEVAWGGPLPAASVETACGGKGPTSWAEGGRKRVPAADRELG